MMWNAGGWGWWGPGLILMVIGMVVMMRMMGHGHGHGSHTAESHGRRPGGAERILAERLARGQIDIEEYERRRAALEQSGELDWTPGGRDVDQP